MSKMKFRVWDKKKCRFYYSDEHAGWRWGDFVIDNRELEVQLWTGLKDRYGIEIYEGDVIRWQDGEDEFVAKIKYGVGQFDGGEYKYIGFYLESDAGEILEPYEITDLVESQEYYKHEVVGHMFMTMLRPQKRGS